MFSKISLIAIGKTSSEFLNAENHYLKLIKTKISTDYLQNLSSLSKNEQIEKESALLSQKAQKCDFTIFLDARGKQNSSEEFAKLLSNASREAKSIGFIIGGSYGLSENALSGASYILSLSKMTLPHQVARILLLEQIYRSETIFSNTSYHK